jgi:hypothetical protein
MGFYDGSNLGSAIYGSSLRVGPAFTLGAIHTFATRNVTWPGLGGFRGPAARAGAS